MKRDLIVIGGGEFARVVIETARDTEWWNVIGFVDPKPCEETTKRLGVLRLGGDEILREYPDAYFILGVGTTKVSDERKKLADRLSIPRNRWAIVTHHSVVMSTTAKLGAGVIALPGAVISSGAQIGDHCIINIGAKIDHDVYVGRYVHVAPQAALGGGCQIGAHSFIGMGAIVRDHTKVNTHTLVAMGAVVNKEFQSGAILVGVPARELK